MKRFYAALLLLAAVLVSDPSAQRKVPRRPEPRPPKTYSLDVRVVAHGQPVANVPVIIVDGAHNIGRTAYSGEDGVAHFAALYFEGFSVCVGRKDSAQVCSSTDLNVGSAQIDISALQRPPPVEPPTNPPASPGIVGQLRIEANGGFIDGNGNPVLPIFCHFGDGYSRWPRDPLGVMRDLATIKRAGYDGIRFWSTLGSDGRPGDFWYGREIGPAFTPNYWAHLEAFLTAVRDAGLKVQFSQGDLFPKTLGNADQFARLVVEVIRRVGPEVVALFEGGNESWQTGQPDARAMARFVQQVHEGHPQILKGLSAPERGEDARALREWSQSPASLWIIHGFRLDHWWDKVRHAFSLAYEVCDSDGARLCGPRVGWQGEPPANGVLVSASHNKHELDADAMVLLHAMHLLSWQGTVYFSGPGVISDCKAGEQINHGRYTCNGERLEDMPGFWEVPKLKAILPPDLFRYDEHFHSGENKRGKRIFAAQGEVRADTAYYRDGRHVTIIYGPGNLNLPIERPFDVYQDVRFGSKGRIVYGKVR